MPIFLWSTRILKFMKASPESSLASSVAIHKDMERFCGSSEATAESLPQSCLDTFTRHAAAISFFSHHSSGRGPVRYAQVPPSLGFGDQGVKASAGKPKIPGKTALVFARLLPCALPRMLALGYKTWRFWMSSTSRRKFPVLSLAPGHFRNSLRDDLGGLC